MSILKIPIGPTDHLRGNPDADHSLVEYGDFECPYCARTHPVTEAVTSHFGPRLVFAFRHFPLGEIHRYAQIAAEAAELAGQHGRFWEMHDLIYENQSALGLPLLLELVEDLRIAPETLELALANGVFRPNVRADFLSGVRSDVQGTPTFFIDEQLYEGAPDLDLMIEAIEESPGRRPAPSNVSAR